MSTVLRSASPAYRRNKNRAVGDRVRVQHIEGGLKEWFECEVTEIKKDPITRVPEYRVKLVDGGAPGTAFEGGKWLVPRRLHDVYGFDGMDSYQYPKTQIERDDRTASEHVVKEQGADPQPSDRSSENETKTDGDKSSAESPASDRKGLANDSSRGTASFVSPNPSSAEEVAVPKPAQPTFSKLVAENIRKNLDESVLQSISTQGHGVDVVSGYILGFATLLVAELVNPESDISQKAPTFARHFRDGIADQLMQPKGGLKLYSGSQASLEDASDGWGSTSTNTPEFSDPSEQTRGLPVPESRPTHALDPLTLDEIPEVQEYLTESLELQWLLERIKRSASLTQTGGEFSSAQTAIVKALEDNPGRLKLTLDWDPFAVLSGQYRNGSLSNMIVYSGSESTCYATTALEYTERVWPQLSGGTLECFEKDLSNSNRVAAITLQGLDLDIRIHDRKTTVELSANSSEGPESWTALLEVRVSSRFPMSEDSKADKAQAAEICVWLATACRDHAQQDTVGMSSLMIQQDPIYLEGGLVFTSTISAMQHNSERQGHCWVDMVHNPVVAVGYPVPKRDDPLQGKGLELSIQLMVALSRASRVTNFDDTIVIKGLVTALVPTSHTHNVVVWHFLVNKDLEPMTYEQATSCAVEVCGITISDLEHKRHCVGLWSSGVRIAAGSNSDVNYDLHKATSEPVNDWTVSLASLPFNGGKFFTAGAAFNFLKKDLAVVHLNASARAYEDHLQRAGNINVLFYSSDDRRAWLIDGASALVHLARAYIESTMAQHKSSGVAGELRHIEGDGGTTAAIDVLKHNRYIKIFDESHITVEKNISGTAIPASQTASSSSSSEVSVIKTPPVKPNTFTAKASVWTYENLVVDFWEYLQEMKAKLNLLKKRSFEKDLRMPGSRLLGWNAKDMICSSDMTEPRWVRLQPDGKSWLKFTRETSPVVLMARSFGNLIIPSPGPHLCKHMTELPRGRDLLALPQYVLATTGEEYLYSKGDDPFDGIRISHKSYLRGYDPSKRDCQCLPSGTSCKNISGLETAAWSDKDSPSSLSIFLASPKAAIIVGKLNSRAKVWVERLWQRGKQDAATSTCHNGALPNSIQAEPGADECVDVVVHDISGEGELSDSEGEERAE